MYKYHTLILSHNFMHVSFEIFGTCQLCPVSATNKQTD